MKKLLWSIVVLIILLIFIGLVSCIETGDEERPGIAISTHLLQSKIWRVEVFKDDGQTKSGLFHNVFLEFRPNFVFRITHGCDIIDGEWILSSDSTLLVIRLPDSPEPLNQFEDEWVITHLTDSEMHLIEQDNKGDEEFLLKVTPLPALNCHSCEQLNQVLTDSVWSITNFTTPAQEYTDETRGAYIRFNSNGELILHQGDDEWIGGWAITDQCRTLVIQWFEDKVYSDRHKLMEDHWFIHGITSQQISLETEEQGRLELTKGRLPNCSESYLSILNTSWFIDHVSINEDNVSENFRGTGLTLLENNQLATDVLIGPAVLGQWMLMGDCNQLTLNIPVGQLKELSREWTITEMSSDQIKLLYEEGALTMEMRLKKGKPTPSANCLSTLGLLINKEWSVTGFEENGAIDDLQTQGFHVQFKEDGTLLAWNSDHQINGTWYPVMDCKKIVVDLDRQSAAGKLAVKWTIDRTYDNRIIMVYEKASVKRTLELSTS